MNYFSTLSFRCTYAKISDCGEIQSIILTPDKIWTFWYMDRLSVSAY